MVAPHITGRRILSARFLSPRVARCRPDQVAGKRIREVRRHGKHILVEFEEGGLLDIHLGMTGKLLRNGRPGPHTHAIFELENGTLLYDDMRQFGRIVWCEAIPERVARLGPDALSVSLDEFTRLLKGRRARIKPLLLNQNFLRGLGNIYSDEALFRARIHPRAIASRLSGARIKRLHRAIAGVLKLALADRGSSVSDYVDGEGRRGRFQRQHKVYGKAGQPCSACGTPIRRIVLAQRGTHYCPNCQRR